MKHQRNLLITIIQYKIYSKKIPTQTENKLSSISTIIETSKINLFWSNLIHKLFTYPNKHTELPFQYENAETTPSPKIQTKNDKYSKLTTININHALYAHIRTIRTSAITLREKYDSKKNLISARRMTKITEKRGRFGKVVEISRGKSRWKTDVDAPWKNWRRGSGWRKIISLIS